MCPKIAKERKKIVSTTQVLCEYRKHSRNHYRMRSINFQLKMVSGEKYPSCFYGKDIENRKWIQLTKKCNKNSNSDISFLQNVLLCGVLGHQNEWNSLANSSSASRNYENYVDGATIYSYCAKSKIKKYIEREN